MRRRVLAVCVCALVAAPAALAATPTGPVYDARGHLVQTPFAPVEPKPQLTKQAALAAFLANGKVHDWLDRYPRTQRLDEETYDGKLRSWTVKIWWGEAGEIATGRVDDATGAVLEAWTGPQVAWKMARGYKGAFGGTKINNPWIWGAFCAAFLLGLADLRRPLSLRNLDLVALLSFSASLWFFNRGDIFTSVPLVYPPLAYLLGRAVWIGSTGRMSRGRTTWPVWVLLGATVFLAGFRIGLNVEASNVIDVGYAGVIGAERIANGQAPYDHMPVEDELKPCGPADSEGEIRDRIQTNGRCESANAQGDTYGPVAYEAYLPGYLIKGWSGKWDDLPAAHLTSILWDVLCLIGLALVGLRFGGLRLAATLAFAWAAYPFTQYASNSNTNDMILPAILIWGFWLSTSDTARGAFAALGAWTKFAPLVIAPLWLTYPDRRPRPRAVAGFVVATVAAFSILLLEPNLWHALGQFWHRTLGWQIGRQSPFSIWDWRQYHARGLPNLHAVQIVLEVLLGVGAVAAAFWPRRKSPLQLAALTAALLIGFELVLTHWFYLYLPWFFPFIAFAALAPGRAEPVVESQEVRDREPRQLVVAG
ncbi:MAG TPA: glycosyltransferase 87 family protein [Gaiellaceae bacterium]